MAMPIFNPLRALLSALGPLMLTACGQYAVTLNGQTLYTPPKLFADYSLQDPALKRCVQQTILENTITQVEQLTQLRCPHLGIKSLAGIERFQQLKVFDAAGNPIGDNSPLLHLPQLQQVNMENTPHADCKAVQGMRLKGVKVLSSDCPEASAY